LISSVFGGIGLFLLGMVLMTEGLKSAAGEALREVLRRFTGNRVQALASGAAVTALVQSSSATVLATIGFVSAGLLSFTQAIGVILGASLGTTSTGWIVSVIGLKLNMGAVALPLVGVGALLRLLTRGRAAAVGLALAGFGLIFVGIDVLQDGMGDLATRFDPGAFPGDSVGGRLLLAGLGVIMTVVMQSSSAAVATTLTALHTGTIGLEQAAALVIGQSIGTTVTSLLASVGASVAARRTALAHLGINGVAGVVAFLILPALLRFEIAVTGPLATEDSAILIAAFHTSFTLIGVLLLLPFTGQLGAVIERLIPDRGPQLTRHLDASLVQLPTVAIEAARRTVLAVAAVLTAALRDAAGHPGPASAAVSDRVAAAVVALDDTRRFMAGVRAPGGAGIDPAHLSTLHAIDHLERLAGRLREPPRGRTGRDADFDALSTDAAAGLAGIHDWLSVEATTPQRARSPTAAELAAALSARVAEHRRDHRSLLLERAARGEIDPDDALARLDRVRWLDSALYHVWRASHHLGGAHPQGQAEEPG
jgi:phosphate:Na+ symporter